MTNDKSLTFLTLFTVLTESMKAIELMEQAPLMVEKTDENKD